MALSFSKNATEQSLSRRPITVSMFPMCEQLKTTEQICGFELLRLAFFALKLRKFEQCHEQARDKSEYEFRCSLLRHAIFQQVLALTALNAREQALQLIDACRK